jgi:hypothetical protein
MFFGVERVDSILEYDITTNWIDFRFIDTFQIAKVWIIKKAGPLLTLPLTLVAVG